VDHGDDLDVESQWWDEFAGALESAARESRRFAGICRGAGRALRPADLATARAIAVGIVRRTIAAGAIALVLGDEPPTTIAHGKGGLK